MGLVSRTADLYYTFKFLKLLVTPWKETDAYKLGIVDENGKVLRRAATLTSDRDKSAYTYFHRLVFNIKRLLEKVPFGKSRIASYAAALYLIKEETGLSDKRIKWIFENMDVKVDMVLKENTWFLDRDGRLQPGVYRLTNDAPIASTGEFRAHAGSMVEVRRPTAPTGDAVGVPVFSVFHKDTQQHVIVSTDDINR